MAALESASLASEERRNPSVRTCSPILIPLVYLQKITCAGAARAVVPTLVL